MRHYQKLESWPREDLPAGWLSVGSYCMDASPSLFNHLKDRAGQEEFLVVRSCRYSVLYVYAMASVLPVHLLMTLSSKVEHCGLWVARFDSTGVNTQNTIYNMY